MANRSGSGQVGRRVRRPPGLGVRVSSDVDDGEDGAGGPIETASGGSAWERMLETLGDEDARGGLEDGLESLHASIAERLRTRAGSLAADGSRSPPRSARRRPR